MSTLRSDSNWNGPCRTRWPTTNSACRPSRATPAAYRSDCPETRGAPEDLQIVEKKHIPRGSDCSYSREAQAGRWFPRPWSLLRQSCPSGVALLRLVWDERLAAELGDARSRARMGADGWSAARPRVASDVRGARGLRGSSSLSGAEGQRASATLPRY